MASQLIPLSNARATALHHRSLRPRFELAVPSPVRVAARLLPSSPSGHRQPPPMHWIYPPASPWIGGRGRSRSPTAPSSSGAGDASPCTRCVPNVDCVGAGGGGATDSPSLRRAQLRRPPPPLHCPFLRLPVDAARFTYLVRMAPRRKTHRRERPTSRLVDGRLYVLQPGFYRIRRGCQSVPYAAGVCSMLGLPTRFSPSGAAVRPHLESLAALPPSPGRDGPPATPRIQAAPPTTPWHQPP